MVGQLDRPAEVADLGVEVGVEQDVFGLQVPVDDPLRVQELDGPDHLEEDLELLAGAQPGPGSGPARNVREQVALARQLQEKVHALGPDLGAKEPDDVGVS